MKRKKLVLIGIAASLALAGGVAMAKNKAGEHRGQHHGGKRMMKMFKQADNNGDKAVSAAEFKAFLDGRFKAADANGDGKVSKDEMVAAIKKQAQANGKGKGKKFARRADRMSERLVNRFDINGDGFVERQELENRANKMYALADWNDDGKVDASELRRGKMRRH